MRPIACLFAIILITGLGGCADPPPPANVLPEAEARAAALAEVPGARVRSHELEREDGQWVYSYDLEVAGHDGVEEILIDAVTGKVVAREHETPEDERKETEKEGEAVAPARLQGGDAATAKPATLKESATRDVEQN